MHEGGSWGRMPISCSSAQALCMAATPSMHVGDACDPCALLNSLRRLCFAQNIHHLSCYMLVTEAQATHASHRCMSVSMPTCMNMDLQAVFLTEQRAAQMTPTVAGTTLGLDATPPAAHVRRRPGRGLCTKLLLQATSAPCWRLLLAGEVGCMLTLKS